MNEIYYMVAIIVLLLPIGLLANALAKARREIRDYEQSFNLYWEAGQRGIALWQEENPGNDMTWPDQGFLICWLMTHHDGLKRRAEEQSRAAVDLFDECQRMKTELVTMGRELEDARHE